MTKDIKPKWLNLIRRLQSKAKQQEGYAIMHATFIVDSNGDPVFWLEPKVNRIEPMSMDLRGLIEESDDAQDILDMLLLSDS